jgi:hypothetical protein
MPASRFEKGDEGLARTARFVRIVRASWAAILLAVIICSALLLSAYGDRFTNAICRETRRVTPFRGPFSSLCHRIVLRRLFFDSLSASVGPL